jgi:CBS domain-containing protein
MPRSVVDTLLREAPLLRSDETLAAAARRVLDSGLPALPVVDGRDRLQGIFGEREFITAAMPGYLRTLHASAYIRRSLDEALEMRSECAAEAVGSHMNAEHVELPAEFSDLQAAETFLHHRVLLLPVIDDDRRVLGVITRADFFRAVAERVLGMAAG